jgi:hypothetical protein
MLPPQDVPEPLFPSSSLDLESLYEFPFLLGAPSEHSVQEITPNPPSSPQDVPASSDFPPQTTAPIDDGTRLCVVCSASISPPPPIPSPQTATFPLFNWKMIPQNVYDHGKKQWDFRPSQSVSFNTNGFPGMNMGDAFRKRFAGLDGRDDPVLQDASRVISYRLLVRLLWWLLSCARVDPVSSSPVTSPTVQSRWGCLSRSHCHALTAIEDFHKELDQGTWPDHA